MTWSKGGVIEKLTVHKDKLSQNTTGNDKLFLNKNYPETSRQSYGKSLTPAAVLVPLVNREDGITVLLTKRTDHLSKHAGQISFPGGQMDKNDLNSEYTALRETEEEIGLKGELIEIVGHLNDYEVGTGFLVSPVIGFIEPPLLLTPHENEVAEVFEAPLYFVTHPDNFENHTREIKGVERNFIAVQWNERFIWGATAAILRDLSQRLWREVPQPSRE